MKPSFPGRQLCQKDAFDLKGSLIALSNAAFEDGELVNLPVVPTVCFWKKNSQSLSAPRLPAMQKDLHNAT
ncbi:MAG: hypothetical protein ACLRW2_03790 [Parasutterella excrementihominis]